MMTLDDHLEGELSQEQVMALVAAAVANGGRVPIPHVLLTVEDADSGGVVDDFDQGTWTTAMSAGTAEILTAGPIVEIVGELEMAGQFRLVIFGCGQR